MSESLDRSRFDRFFDARRPAIAADLCEYISLNTQTPHESECFAFLARYLEPLGAPLQTRDRHPLLSAHPDLSPHPDARTEGGPSSGFAVFENGHGATTTTRFNAHIDVVPASPEDPAAFEPRVDAEAIWGRGACDTKGSLVMLAEAMRFIGDEGVSAGKRVELDLPAEEEIGGNGTLSNILYGGRVDEAICLEPTGLEVFRGHRGCLTFSVDMVGRSVHMGEAASGVSAIEGAVAMMASLRELEGVLLQQARSHDAFARWEWPLSLNIGKINGGEWSGTVPERCTLVGDLGFLPTHSLEDVEGLIREACAKAAEVWPGGSHRVRFHRGLRNDACLTAESAPVVEEWAGLTGVLASHIAGWNVSCDARHYVHAMGVPTIVVGPGSLKNAHSAHEHVAWSELREGVWMLAQYVARERAAGSPTDGRQAR